MNLEITRACEEDASELIEARNKSFMVEDKEITEKLTLRLYEKRL